MVGKISIGNAFTQGKINAIGQQARVDRYAPIKTAHVQQHIDQGRSTVPAPYKGNPYKTPAPWPGKEMPGKYVPRSPTKSPSPIRERILRDYPMKYYKRRGRA